MKEGLDGSTGLVRGFGGKGFVAPAFGLGPVVCHLGCLPLAVLDRGGLVGLRA